MSKGGSKAPPAPDPAATAAAQTATNKETAYWNAVLNNVNQVTPYGNLTYTQTGGGKKYNMEGYNAAMDAFNKAAAAGNAGSGMFNGYKLGAKIGGQYQLLDPKTGKFMGYVDQRAPSLKATATNAVSMPKLEDFYIGESPPEFTSTIELTPEQQAILDRQQANELAMVNLGGEQIGRIRDSVSNPFSFDGLESPEVAQGQFEDAIYSRLDPQFARDEEALRTRLINQGIGQNSEAYAKEFERLNQAKTDARMQATLKGQDYALNRRNQAISEYMTQRNAPLNEYIGLTSGVQVQNPQFSSQGYQGTQPVDYAGLINQQYQSQLGSSNANAASRNATMGGLFSLGGSLLAAPATGGGSLFANLFGF